MLLLTQVISFPPPPSIQSQVKYCYMEYFLSKTFSICECQVVEMNYLLYNMCKIVTLAVGEKFL